MRIKRGFLFTVEAFLALLAALALVVAFSPLPTGNRNADVGWAAYSRDMAHATLSTQPDLLHAASRGEPLASQQLRSSLQRFLQPIPGACAGVDWEGGPSITTCGEIPSSRYPAGAIYWDGAAFSHAEFWVAPSFGPASQ